MGLKSFAATSRIRSGVISRWLGVEDAFRAQAALTGHDLGRFFFDPICQAMKHVYCIRCLRMYTLSEPFIVNPQSGQRRFAITEMTQDGSSEFRWIFRTTRLHPALYLPSLRQPAA